MIKSNIVLSSIHAFVHVLPYNHAYKHCLAIKFFMLHAWSTTFNINILLHALITSYSFIPSQCGNTRYIPVVGYLKTVLMSMSMCPLWLYWKLYTCIRCSLSSSRLLLLSLLFSSRVWFTKHEVTPFLHSLHVLIEEELVKYSRLNTCKSMLDTLHNLYGI